MAPTTSRARKTYRDLVDFYRYANGRLRPSRVGYECEVDPDVVTGSPYASVRVVMPSREIWGTRPDGAITILGRIA